MTIKERVVEIMTYIIVPSAFLILSPAYFCDKIFHIKLAYIF